MSIEFIQRVRNFFRTTLLGGLAAVLPLALMVIVIRWIIHTIENFLGPLVELIDTDSQIQVLAIYCIVIFAILLVFFLVGLIIRTRVGRFFKKVLEKQYLMRIPGYKIVKDTVRHFFGKNQSFFSEVVLVDLFNSGTLMTGFITDTHESYITVFVPTGPNPTSGNIYHVKSEKVIRTTTPVDTGMKSIISCGAGSEEVFKGSAFSKRD